MNDGDPPGRGTTGDARGVGGRLLDRSPYGVGRRRFLRTAGVAVAAVATAGCGEEPSTTYSARRAGLSREGLEALQLRSAEHVTVRHGSSGDDGTGDDAAGADGTGDDASGDGTTGDDATGGDASGDDTSGDGAIGDVGRTTFESRLSVYRGVLAQQGRMPLDDWTRSDPDARGVGVLATPAPSVLDRSPNPLATRPLRSLVARSRVADVLARAGAGGGRFEWVRRPDAVAERSAGTLLGVETTVETFVAVVRDANGARETLLVHLSRVRRDGDAVLVVAVQRRRTPAGPLPADPVGTDGHVTTAALADRVRFPVAVDGYVTVTNPVAGSGGADAETAGPVRTDGPDPLRTENGD